MFALRFPYVPQKHQLSSTHPGQRGAPAPPPPRVSRPPPSPPPPPGGLGGDRPGPVRVGGVTNMEETHDAGFRQQKAKKEKCSSVRLLKEPIWFGQKKDYDGGEQHRPKMSKNDFLNFGHGISKNMGFVGQKWQNFRKIWSQKNWDPFLVEIVSKLKFKIGGKSKTHTHTQNL